ncbi:MAG: MFS transporter [Planctomycetota bacterium]
MTDEQGTSSPATRRERLSWALFDFGNSAFNTVVITFVYAIYFREQLCGGLGDNGARGDELWARGQSISAISVAILAPLLGAWVDRKRGRKKTTAVVLMALTLLCTIGLYFPTGAGEGTVSRASSVWGALILVVVANAFFELLFVLYNAFLPELGDEKTVGRLSGLGWGIGYLGGVLCLVLVLFLFLGDDPLVSSEGGQNLRATNLLVAAWFLVFAMPFVLFVKDRGGQAVSERRKVRDAISDLKRTLIALRAYPDLLRLFLGRLLYNDAILALTGLAALYMSGTLGMDADESVLVAIWLYVIAGFAAFGFGYFDDRVGSKPTILISVGFVFVGAALAILVPTANAFWVAVTLIGVGMGPAQSASRSLLTRFVDKNQSAEFFGLFALTGKATAWVGPLLFSVIVEATQSQRWALTPTVLMLGGGMLIVFSIDEERGKSRVARGNSGE